MDSRVIWIIAFVFMAGCGDGGSGRSPQMPSRFMYVSADQGPNEFYTEIFAFAVASDGALQPVAGFTPVPSSLPGGGPLAITRDSKLLFTTDTDLGSGLFADQIKVFQINPDGSLTPAPSPTLSMADGPVDLVAHPTADLLYVSSGSGVLSVFAINSGTGALALKSSVKLGSNIKVHSAVITPNGKYLYQAYVYYPNGFTQSPALPQLAAFSIDPVTGALSAVPGSPVSISTNLSIGTMSIDPTGKFLYATYNDHNEVAAFVIDATSGTLTAVPESPFTVGGSASTILTTIAIDASGNFLIVGLEPGASSKCLDVLSIDSGTGALTPVPGSPFGPAALFCPEVVADPSEPLVYAGTGGGQAGPGVPPATVVALSVDPTTGSLTPVGEASVPATTLANVDVIAMTH